MQLRHPREHVRAHPRLHVERRPLMGVLAVGEVELLLPRRDPVLRQRLVAAAEPAADRGVVASGVREGLVGEPMPRRRRQLAGLLELTQHGVVALGLDHDRDEAVVLGGGADHRRPPDVDLLDRLLLGHVVAGDRALERIEVDADQVDRLDLAFAQGRGVLGVVADRQQRRVQVGVKRLDAAVEDLGEPGQVLDLPHLDPRLLEHGRRAAGRDDLHPELRQARSEVGRRGLVGHRDQRPPHRQRLAGGLGEALVSGGGRHGWAESIRGRRGRSPRAGGSPGPGGPCRPRSAGSPRAAARARSRGSPARARPSHGWAAPAPDAGR